MRFGLRPRLFAAPLAVLVSSGLILAAAHPPILDALKAAGVGGGTPIEGLGTFVARLRASLLWLAVTWIGVTVIIVGLLFLFGHSRAQDIALKSLAGAAIIASAGGIVS